MKQAAYDLRYLAACAACRIAPDKARLEAMNLENLQSMSSTHSLSALAASVLSSAGVKISPAWTAQKEKAVRRNILFDCERAKILRFMEEHAIWYMPMKGVILKDMYPGLGMREMADNDILFDPTRGAEVAEFMKQNGYEAESVGKEVHDTYFKPPVFNFELHTAMFNEYTSKVFSDYYRNIKDRLLPDEGKQYGYHMSDDDYYIHLTAHEYKHYSHSGTGLRSLLDRYIYLSKKQTHLHFDYIEAECRTLGIESFEKASRALCQKVFGSPELPALTKQETEMLEYYMFSSTYGNMSQRVRNRMKQEFGTTSKGTKFRYLMRRIFPNVEFYKFYAPIAYRYKILIPAAWCYRLIRAIFKSRKQIQKEIEIVNRLDSQ